MRIGWYVPLPGPFSVGGTINGRAIGGLLVGLAKLTYYVRIWPVWIMMVLMVRGIAGQGPGVVA